MTRSHSPDSPSRLALVVLGCALRKRGEELAEGALLRRVRAAAGEWARTRDASSEADRPAFVVATGGRAWSGEVEADAMARALVALGVPENAVVRERASLDTRDNARFTAAVCARRGAGRVVLVTCGFHLERARACFEREGLDVVREISAGPLGGGWAVRRWTLAKERFLLGLVSAK